MTVTVVLDALTASPATPTLAVVLMLLVGGWILVASAQRRRD